MLLAMRQESLGQWVCVSVALGDGATEVAVRTLAAWEGREGEGWGAFVGGNGRVRTLTYRGAGCGWGGSRRGQGAAAPLPIALAQREGAAPGQRARPTERG